MTKKTTEFINSNMRLHTVNTDIFKISRFSVNFITERNLYKTPLQKLMLAVMLRGSEKYPTVTAINKALDEQYGAAVHVRSSNIGDKTVHKISCKILKNQFVFSEDEGNILENVIAIVADVIMHPITDGGSFLSSYVESEKKIMIDHIRSKINDPKNYSLEQCLKHMFVGSRFAGTEDADMVSRYTPEEVTEAFKSFFKECKIEFYYIGNESHENIKALINKYFPLCGCCTNALEYRENAFFKESDEVRYIEEEKSVSQGRLALGYRCDTVISDSGYYAMVIFNEIFGGSSVSKLFLNVREKKSLCYYCYSSYSSSTGTIIVGCGIDPDMCDIAMQEIAFQLESMKRGDITEAELDTAKNSIISGYTQINDSPSSIEASGLRKLLASVNDDTELSCEKIKNVTLQDVISAAEKVKLDTVYFLKGDYSDEEEEYNE